MYVGRDVEDINEVPVFETQAKALKEVTSQEKWARKVSEPIEYNRFSIYYNSWLRRTAAHFPINASPIPPLLLYNST